MLVLTVKPRHTLNVGNAKIINLSPRVWKVGVEAPKDVPVRRQEVAERIQREQEGGQS